MPKNSKEYQKEHYRKYKEQKKQYALEHKAHIQEYRRKYYQRNKKSMREQQKDYYAIPENRAKRLLWKARSRAIKEGIAFDLEISDIVIPSKCPYLDITLTHELGAGQLESNSSIDRLDSSKGYVKGNVQIISRKANTMKSNADVETLLKFAEGIQRVHGK